MHSHSGPACHCTPSLAVRQSHQRLQNINELLAVLQQRLWCLHG